MFRFKIVEPADIIEYYNCLNVGGHAAPQDRIRQCRCKDPWLGPPAFHFTSNFTRGVRTFTFTPISYVTFTSWTLP